MSQKNLDFESLRYMAEKVHGSFSFSVLDDKDNLFLVKGDSPLCLLHFPKSQIYVYASTESILFKALIDTPLFHELKKGEYEEAEIFSIAGAKSFETARAVTGKPLPKPLPSVVMSAVVSQ